jgi:prepilin-type N-terminal cleavage/methylation domain-containing protein
MFMRSLNKNARHQASGFSLIEMVIVLAIIMVAASISFMSAGPVMKQQRVTNAYTTTLAAMRLARGYAVAQRTSYSVAFANAVSPSPYATVTVAPVVGGLFQGERNTVTYQLPQDVSFLAQSGLPTASTAVPDGYGSGATAIDFGWTQNGIGTGGQSTIYFCPDGSSQRAPGTNNDGSCPGTWDGGVVYLARAGDLLSSRAITVMGVTGRIRGWRLYANTGGYQWQRQ